MGSRLKPSRSYFTRNKMCPYGQFNLIDRLSSPPAPQKLARPNFFYFVEITFSRNVWCQTPVFILQILFLVRNMLGALNDTPFVDKNKIVINSLPWGNKNYKIKSSQPSHILW
jgi:hypothetical protein